jgi:hypothetical protein
MSSYQILKTQSRITLIRSFKLLIFFTFLILLCTKSVNSQELLTRFHDWSLFRSKRNNQNICYIVSTPIKREGNYLKRGEPYLMITEVKNDIDEVSSSAGFIFKDSANIEISFGGKKFNLFPFKTIAWSQDKNEDIEIIKEMQKNADIIITSIANDGKIAIDTYSLIGFVESYNKLKQLCDLDNNDKL